MTDTKPETWLPAGDTEALACDACGAKLFPGDWLTRDEVLM